MHFGAFGALGGAPGLLRGPPPRSSSEERLEELLEELLEDIFQVRPAELPRSLRDGACHRHSRTASCDLEDTCEAESVLLGAVAALADERPVQGGSVSIASQTVTVPHSTR